MSTFSLPTAARPVGARRPVKKSGSTPNGHAPPPKATARTTMDRLPEPEVKPLDVRDLDVGAIVLDAGTQPRAYTARDRYVTYAEDMDRGDIFPPVIVYTDASNTYWLGDGFHRVRATLHLHALRQEESGEPLPPPTIRAEIRHELKGETGLRAAILHACAANHGPSHGIPRTQEDKRLAVDRLLKDPAWGGWSDRAIADWCHVGYRTVGERRGAIHPPTPSGQIAQMNAGHATSGHSTRTVARGGTVYQQNTANIAAANRERSRPPGASRHPGSDDYPPGAERAPGHDRVAGYREPETHDRGLRVENTVNGVILSLSSLPAPQVAARLVRGLDVVKVEAASAWLSDFVVELQDRHSQSVAR